MIEIPISMLREMFRLDADTGTLYWVERPRHHFKTDRLWKIFNSQFAGRKSGCHEGNGYLQCRVTVDGLCRLFKAHRIVWALHRGEWPKAQIDHRNMDRTDNRPDNLREATNSQNQFNKACRKDSLSCVKGVSFDPERGKYRARIRVNGKVHWLGRFESVGEAAEVYAAAAASLHGDFSRPTGRTVQSTAGRAEREWRVK